MTALAPYLLSWCPKKQPPDKCNPCAVYFRYVPLAATQQTNLVQIHFASLQNNPEYSTSLFIPYVYNQSQAWESIKNLWWDASKVAPNNTASVDLYIDGTKWLEILLSQSWGAPPAGPPPPPFGHSSQIRHTNGSGIPRNIAWGDHFVPVAPAQAGLADGIYYLYATVQDGIERPYTFNQVTEDDGTVNWWMKGLFLTCPPGGSLGVTQDLVFNGTWNTSDSQPLDATANSMYYGFLRSGSAPIPPIVP
jgi:hypothetical protein